MITQVVPVRVHNVSNFCGEEYEIGKGLQRVDTVIQSYWGMNPMLCMQDAKLLMRKMFGASLFQKGFG